MMRDKTGKLALAIGDGADDIGMILQADVGVGVSGKEDLLINYSFYKNMITSAMSLRSSSASAETVPSWTPMSRAPGLPISRDARIPRYPRLSTAFSSQGRQPQTCPLTI
jgi:magnesium-transporting ATPase (P-type)